MTVARLTFLGTAAARPTARRGVSCTALRMHEDTVLVDCGEGTQRQMLRFGLGLGADLVCFTHFHGDHYYGLEPWLRSLRLMAANRDVLLLGPRETAHRVLEPILETMRHKLTFGAEIRALEGGDTVERRGFSIRAVKVDHTVPSLGWVFAEPDRPGRFNVDAARALGVPEGRDFGRLQAGETVRTPDGAEVRPDQVLGAARPGRTIVFSGDTRPCDALIEASRGATLLVHEATFAQELQDRAELTCHSTAAEAGRVAAAAGVRRLVLNHLSTRYDQAPHILEAEARRHFDGDIIVAEDGMVLELDLDGELL